MEQPTPPLKLQMISLGKQKVKQKTGLSEKNIEINRLKDQEEFRREFFRELGS